ncbi:MAG: hypothetical protein JWO95_3216 [Verrucomicrobiales bacterium]|nr:hypothetical protein [Verrucomicrobiales bacterium]
MKNKVTIAVKTILTALLVALGIQLVNQPISAFASGSSGGGGSTSSGGSNLDTIKISKCYYDAPTSQMLIKASSSNPSARLYAYRPDGTYQGEVQNGGGSRYGGTVMGYISYDPQYMVIVSSAGGTITVPTTPFIL